MSNALIRARQAAPFILAAPFVGHLGEYAVNSNTLTGLIPDLYAGLDIVSRELVGYIPSVYRNAAAERAALNQNVTYPIVPDAVAADTTPSMTVPTPPDQTIGTGQLAITKSRHSKFAVNGEEKRSVDNGLGYNVIQANQFAQALRVLTNEVESDLGTKASLGATRAYGTAGTTPFASGVGDAAQMRKIMDDNGAPPGSLSGVINTSAGANMRTNTQLTKANEAGQFMTLRDGELINLAGISWKESAQVKNVTKGTNNGSASTNNAGYAVGSTVITLASAGTGTIVAGDVITFAGDTNKYVVVSGDADVSNGGSITIQKPGLRVAIPASNTVITTGASYVANSVFSANALHLIARLPALPDQGDLAIDRMTMVDPRSGLVFEVAYYAGFRMVGFFVFLAWGTGAVKPEHIATLLG